MKGRKKRMCVCVCACAEGTPVNAHVQLFQRDVDTSLCLTTPSPITDVHRLNPSMQCRASHGYANTSAAANMWSLGKFCAFGSTSFILLLATPNHSAIGLHTASKLVVGMNRPPLLNMF